MASHGRTSSTRIRQFSSGLPALLAARKHGLPFVYEIRDLWENASVDRGKFRHNSPLYRLARGLETYVLRRADAVVTICEALRWDVTTRVSDPRQRVRCR